MDARIPSLAGPRRGFYTVLLILALALRLVGPLPGAPARDGYVGICVGSEILYLPLADLDRGDTEGATEKSSTDSVPCPWFAQFHVLPAVALSLVVLWIARSTAFPMAWGGAVLARPAPHSFQARAPPIGPGFP
jgi:hypothetical protein